MTDAAFWDRAAEKYSRDPISNPDQYEATLGLMRSYLQPEHHVLEIGCGTGSTALELAPGVASYTATDLSAEMIRIARGKLTDDLPADLAFEVGRAGALPDGSFDAILALNLLHLVRDLETVIDRVFERLPSGGLFIAKTGLLKDGAFFLRPLILAMQLVGKAPYVRRLSASELRAMLTDAGFELIEDFLQPDTAPRLFTVARKP